MTAVYILTSPRRTADPWQYLRATLLQLEAEDLDVPVTLLVDQPPAPADPGQLSPTWMAPSAEREARRIEDDGFPLVPRAHVIPWRRPDGALPGNKLPYWALLERALEDGAADAVVLEDDLELCRNGLRRMASFAVPHDLAWVQFFAPHLFQVRETHPGLWRPPLGSHQFLQAAKFPRRTLQALVDWHRTDPQWGKFTASDSTLALASRRLGLDYGAHAPELVQHAGELSLTGAGDELADYRRAKTWPGEEFDALSLYVRDELFR